MKIKSLFKNLINKPSTGQIDSSEDDNRYRIKSILNLSAKNRTLPRLTVKLKDDLFIQIQSIFSNSNLIKIKIFNEGKKDNPILMIDEFIIDNTESIMRIYENTNIDLELIKQNPPTYKKLNTSNDTSKTIKMLNVKIDGKIKLFESIMQFYSRQRRD